MPDLSIIIVNWRSIGFTMGCIESIRSTTRAINYEVIVVDNGSEDDCDVLSERYPWVKLIYSDRNLGFAGANNLGVQHARGDKILFLNPDTVVLGQAIARMAACLDGAPEIGVLGCRLLNPDLTLQTSCVQPFPNILNQLFGIEWLRRRWPGMPIWGTAALFSETAGGVSEVEAVSGACLMIRRDVFDAAGQFSTEYFMYAEEIDLCYTIRRSGRKVCHVGDAQVVHFGGQSTKKQIDGFAEVVMRESVFKLLSKFRGKAYAWVYRVALLLSAVGRMAILYPLLVLPGRLLNREAVVRAFDKWHHVANWSLATRRRG